MFVRDFQQKQYTDPTVVLEQLFTHARLKENNHKDASSELYTPICENTGVVNQLLTNLQNLPYSDRIFVVGSVAANSEKPGDLDILVDYSDYSSDKVRDLLPKVNQLIKLARKHYGSFDPFVLVGNNLITRNDDANGWQKAKNASQLLKSFNKQKKPLNAVKHLNENREVKKHKIHDGLDLSIEIPAGSYRTGTNKKTGEEWKQKMGAHYGYIKLTGAPDGDHLDCFLRKKPIKNAKIYVVHQLTVDGSGYDEDKVMLGYDSKQEAKRAWREHAFKPQKMFGAMSEFEPEHFKAIVHSVRNSNVCIAKQDVFDELDKKGVLQNGTKSPNAVMRKLSEAQLNELYDRVVKWEWTKKVKDQYEAFFTVGDSHIAVDFHRVYDSDQYWMVEFYDEAGEYGSYEPTNKAKGKVFTILATIADIVEAFVRDIKPGATVYFHANEQSGHFNVYRHMLGKLRSRVKKYGYMLDIKRPSYGGDPVIYLNPVNTTMQESNMGVCGEMNAENDIEIQQKQILAKLKSAKRKQESATAQFTADELGDAGVKALQALEDQGVICVNTEQRSKTGLPINWEGDFTSWGGDRVYTIYTIDYVDGTMKKANQPKLYGNLKELSGDVQEYENILTKAGFRKTGGGPVGGEMIFWKGRTPIILRMHPMGGALGWKIEDNQGNIKYSGTDPESLARFLKKSKLGEMMRLKENQLKKLKAKKKKYRLEEGCDNEDKSEQEVDETTEDTFYMQQVMENLKKQLSNEKIFEATIRRNELRKLSDWQLAQEYMDKVTESAPTSLNKKEIIDSILTAEGY